MRLLTPNIATVVSTARNIVFSDSDLGKRPGAV